MVHFNFFLFFLELFIFMGSSSSSYSVSSTKPVGESAVAAVLSDNLTANRIVTPHHSVVSRGDYRSCISRSWTHQDRGKTTDQRVFLLPLLPPARNQSPSPSASSPPPPCSRTAHRRRNRNHYRFKSYFQKEKKNEN